MTGMVYCPNCILKNGKIEKSQQWGKVWYGISFEVSAMVLLVWCVELACDRKTKEYSQELQQDVIIYLPTRVVSECFL